MTGPVERKTFTPKARPKPADLIAQAEAMAAKPERFTEEQAKALAKVLDRMADEASDRAEALKAEADEAEEQTEAFEEAFNKLNEMLEEEGHAWGTDLPAPEVPGQLALFCEVAEDVPPGVA